MIENQVDVPTEDGALEARLFLPDDEGPWPLVVFYMDAFGLRPALSEMAERLVDAGYAVAQPNLYWRSSSFEPFDPAAAFGDAAERERLMKLLNAVRVDQVASDTLALVDEVTEDRRVQGNRFGCVGYCMGGRMAFAVAKEIPERVAAAASIHPGGLVTDEPDSPHRKASQIRGVVYLGIADEDRGCTVEHQRALRQALEDAGVRHTLELYTGAHHGFAVPDLPVFDRAAAERQWQRVLGLFDTELRA